MFNTGRRILIGTCIAAAVAAAAATGLEAQGVKITDPTSVVMIVNRDSNDIGFMDIKTKKMIGNVFLGNNVNPHMVMMSPDGRYVVTGGTRANRRSTWPSRPTAAGTTRAIRTAIRSR
jgi:hypothetical protein